MGGSSIETEWEFTEPSGGTRTIVLVGKTGNGKSATGNTILGRKLFKSRTSSLGVTSSCELQTTVMNDGEVVNVIDTPGLFDPTVDSDFVSKEITNCIKMAQNGIHAVVLVSSVRNRFTEEEKAAVFDLQSLFGAKITDFMIVLFTGGDDLEENDQTLDDYLCSDCQTSSPLQEVLSLCDNRMVLFDNKTTDEFTRVEQVNQLMKLVNRVVEQNGGKPYTNDIFEMLQKQAAILRDKQQFEADSLNSKAAAELISLKEEMNRSYEEQFQRLNEMISRKLRETTEKMEEKLRAEQAARLEAEKAAEESRKLIEKLEKADMETKKVAEEARLRADEESHQLREQLKKAKIEARKLQKEAKEQCKELQKLQKVHDREAEELRRLQAEKNSCSIL